MKVKDIKAELVAMWEYYEAKRNIILASLDETTTDGNANHISKVTHTMLANEIADVMDELNKLIEKIK